MRLLLLAGLAVAAFLIAHGLALASGVGGDAGDRPMEVALGLVQGLLGAAIGAGLLISGKRRTLGVGLVAGSVIILSVLWYWFMVVTVPVGIVLVSVAYARGRRAALRRSRGTV